MCRAVAAAAIAWLKQRLRGITRRTRGRSLIEIAKEVRGNLPGWKAYFRLAQAGSDRRLLDAWLRHRLRAIQLKQCKTAGTAYREMRRRGARPTHIRLGQRRMSPAGGAEVRTP